MLDAAHVRRGRGTIAWRPVGSRLAATDGCLPCCCSIDDAAPALGPLAGAYATALFGLGLFGASMLAARVLPLSTAYAMCGAFGWEPVARACACLGHGPASSHQPP
jgi:hypothetical protein